MQQVACPGCGAPVQFKSSASVMAVCEFCKTTLLKDAASVKNLGKMSEVLEDYSPLQIGTSGQFSQRGFSLIGRIQLRYSAGFWNEWYALFDDGTNGWLSDASGQFTMTFVKATDANLPLFEKLMPGRPLSLAGQTFVTSDVRVAECTAGQGELPFKVGKGFQARVADFRADDRFLSLDYSDDDGVRVYVGKGVKLPDLKPQLLRDTTAIADSAGRFQGKVTAFACPSCGAPINGVAGVTVHAICPSCHCAMDTSGPIATVLAAGTALAKVHFTLALGDEAAIDGARFRILGAMRRAAGVGADESVWSEYLLYSPGRAFIWLIETADAWQRTEVLDMWPATDETGHALLDGRRYNATDNYSARVTFAAGSFNWRVSIGDLVQVREFSAGPVGLAAEATAEELTWSRSSRIALDQVRAWFGAHVHADRQPHPSYCDTARRIVIVFLIVNAIPLLFASDDVLQWALLGAAAIYVPAYFLDKLDAAS